jgi:hypothetical protein
MILLLEPQFRVIMRLDVTGRLCYNIERHMFLL